MPYRTLGSHAPGVQIVVMHATMANHPEDPPPGTWNMHLIDRANQHELTITADTADDLGDFVTRLVVQGATAMQGAGMDLAGRIHASLVVARLHSLASLETTLHTQQEETP